MFRNVKGVKSLEILFKSNDRKKVE